MLLQSQQSSHLQSHGRSKMSYVLNEEIQEILGGQPKLTLEESSKEFIIQGVYEYSLDFDGYIAQGERKIKLTVVKNFPNSIPKLFVYDNPKKMEHIYTDGSVCLATTGEMIYFLTVNPSLIAFVHKFVNAFIFTMHWFEKYGTYPFGDRSHGYKGSLDYYLGDLKLTKVQYKAMVSIIYGNRYRGHMPCICGSGRKLRACHGKYMLPIIKNPAYKNEFLNEACEILTEDGKIVSKKSTK